MSRVGNAKRKDMPVVAWEDPGRDPKKGMPDDVSPGRRDGRQRAA